jgi:hypothetical protein
MHWEIINNEKGISKQDIGIQAVMHDNKLIMNQKEMADTFNNYFLNIAVLLNENNKMDRSSSIDNSIQFFILPFGHITDIGNVIHL